MLVSEDQVCTKTLGELFRGMPGVSQCSTGLCELAVALRIAGACAGVRHPGDLHVVSGQIGREHSNALGNAGRAEHPSQRSL